MNTNKINKAYTSKRRRMIIYNCKYVNMDIKKTVLWVILGILSFRLILEADRYTLNMYPGMTLYPSTFLKLLNLSALRRVSTKKLYMRKWCIRKLIQNQIQPVFIWYNFFWISSSNIWYFHSHNQGWNV